VPTGVFRVPANSRAYRSRRPRNPWTCCGWRCGARRAIPSALEACIRARVGCWSYWTARANGRAAGIEALRQSIAEIAPWLGDRLDAIADWSQTSVLSVQAGCARRWYRAGVLLIGDAAHIMSPVAGVGINYAIQDAIVASNRLGPRLLRGCVRLSDLAAVQRRREWPTRLMQRMQAAMQQRIETVGGTGAKRPWPLRILELLPPITELRTRLVAYGGLAPEKVAPLQPQLAGLRRQVRARADLKFVEHMLHMVGGGLLGDHQRLSHLAIRQPARDQASDL
jgi:2-polyprenyl-6-methoxyphenol hydroxylase-like FAD-dependent oxidoreductase